MVFAMTLSPGRDPVPPSLPTEHPAPNDGRKHSHKLKNNKLSRNLTNEWNENPLEPLLLFSVPPEGDIRDKRLYGVVSLHEA